MTLFEKIFGCRHVWEKVSSASIFMNDITGYMFIERCTKCNERSAYATNGAVYWKIHLEFAEEMMEENKGKK